MRRVTDKQFVPNPGQPSVLIYNGRTVDLARWAPLFYAKIEYPSDPFECFVWVGGRNPKGYGMFHGIPSHRFAWMLAYHPIPDGQCVCHDCDNPSCVNPCHLFLGSHADNVADRVSKGRSAKQAGDLHPQRKLSSDDVRAIRKIREEKSMTVRAAAEMYGVSIGTVEQLVRRTTWKNVE